LRNSCETHEKLSLRFSIRNYYRIASSPALAGTGLRRCRRPGVTLKFINSGARPFPRLQTRKIHYITSERRDPIILCSRVPVCAGIARAVCWTWCSIILILHFA
jgi:hypothetical protein